MSDTGTHTWPELAVGMFDQLTGRGAEISYRFEELEVQVPSNTGENAKHAKWKLNGTIKITTKDDVQK